MNAYAPHPYSCVVMANGCDQANLDASYRIAKDAGVGFYYSMNKNPLHNIKEFAESLSTKCFCWCHDDVGFVPGNPCFWQHLLAPFDSDMVAATGPVSNASDGYQHYLWVDAPPYVKVHNLHIPLTMWNTSIYKKLGGHDLSMENGMDVDLSIRAHQCGYDLVVARNAYMNHVGGATQESINELKSASDSYWWVQKTGEKMDNDLIKKHGVAVWADYGSRSHETAQTRIFHGYSFNAMSKALSRKPQEFRCVSQLAEETGLDPVQCEFESRRTHQL